MRNKTSNVIHRQEAQIGGILQAIFYSVRVSQSPHAEPFSFHQLAFHNAVYYLTLGSAFSPANLEGFVGGALRQVGVIMPDVSWWDLQRWPAILFHSLRLGKKTCLISRKVQLPLNILAECRM